MRAVLAGYRIVFEERAVAFDRTSQTPQRRARRKMRTLAGNYQILGQEPRLLVPVVNPCGSVRVAQGRAADRPLGSAHFLVTSVFAGADQSVYYAAALTVQVGFYAFARVRRVGGKCEGDASAVSTAWSQVGRGAR